MDEPTTVKPSISPLPDSVPTWHLWLAPIIWAAHFLAICAFAALTCSRVGSSNGFSPSAVPVFVGGASLVASLVLLSSIVCTLRACLKTRSQPLAQTPSRDFIDWLSAAIAVLVLIAVLWETLALAWVPACG